MLVRAKKLSGYQAQEIYKGSGQSLVMGNYVILDKLGHSAYSIQTAPENGKGRGSVFGLSELTCESARTEKQPPTPDRRWSA